MAYKKPKFTEKDLGFNPFINSLVIPVIEKHFKEQYKKSDDVLVPVIQEVEYTEIAKLYCSAERRKITNNLSLRAKELFLWIMYEIDHGKDFLWVNKKRYMEEVEITAIDTYKNAMKELIRYGFLGLTVIQDVFWINPDLFFKGNRITKYPNKIEKRE